MDNATHLRLDVHKETIAVAILRSGEAEPDERTIANTPEALRALTRRGSFEHPVACYEAGPTGYETHRAQSARCSRSASISGITGAGLEPNSASSTRAERRRVRRISESSTSAASTSAR